MIDDEHSTKLIEAKIRFAQEQRFIALQRSPDNSGRLPPGQAKVKGLPVLDLGIHPELTHTDWRLVIDGAVEHPCVLDWQQFTGLEQADALTDIHCVTSWSSFDNHWSGVRFGTLADLVGPTAAATHVMLHGYDGYTTNIPIEELLQDNCLVATSWNGELLSESHGGPARLVIPQLYFWKSAKWISRIEFLKEDAPGYWEQRGYHNDGDPWVEQRYGKRLLPAADTAIIEAPPTKAEDVVLAQAESLLTRIKGWVSYHFFPD